MYILNPVNRHVYATRLAATAALISSICRNRDVALLSQMLGVQTCDLFFDATIRMRHNDCGIPLFRIIVCRRVDVGDNIQPIEIVVHRVDIDFARLILCDRTAIHECVGILLVVGCDGGGRCGHGTDSYACQRKGNGGCTEKRPPIDVNFYVLHSELHLRIRIATPAQRFAPPHLVNPAFSLQGSARPDRLFQRCSGLTLENVYCREFQYQEGVPGGHDRHVC
ncbi:hypothetical protein SAMN02982985_00627 [Rugamonas rubra]|uniref:Uncharacterized protein n=1 Tax=Rugamonas rubra TaxID=758825 RepID=A0A1I4IKJ6_9BURK|nr:hypothetical protein SAMN02982985_00627 [Rugamonas rubra]